MIHTYLPRRLESEGTLRRQIQRARDRSLRNRRAV